MAIVKKNFRVVAPVNTKSVDDKEDGLFYIEGIANSGQEDLVGDVVTEQALTRIVEQAPTRNLHYNHDGDKEDILGTIVESELREEGAWIKASILSEQTEWLKSYLTQGIKFGFSISGTCDYEDGSISDIIDWQLTEISLTDTPCDPQTMGSVSMSKSFDDCIKLVQQKQQIKMEEETMADDNNDVKYITEEDAIELINTAFNERKDEFIEAIMKEYDAKIEALEAKIEALLEEEKPQETEEEEKETPSESEEKAEDNDGEDKPEDEEEEEEKTYTEEELKNILESEVEKGVQAKVKSIFDEVGKTADFQYEVSAEEETVEKKSYTAKELAEMGVI